MDAETPTSTQETDVEKAAGALEFALPPELTIKTAESIAAVFKEIPLGENMRLVFNAAHVERLTTPGAQLLLSLGKSLEANHGSLTITNKTEPFLTACRDMGLRAWLD